MSKQIDFFVRKIQECHTCVVATAKMEKSFLMAVCFYAERGIWLCAKITSSVSRTFPSKATDEVVLRKESF